MTQISFTQRPGLFLGQKVRNGRGYIDQWLRWELLPAYKVLSDKAQQGQCKGYAIIEQIDKCSTHLTERWHSVWRGSQERSQGFKGEGLHSTLLLISIDQWVRWEQNDISSNAQTVNQQGERAVGEKHQRKTSGLPGISLWEWFCNTDLRGMSGPIGFANPSGKALLTSFTLNLQEKRLECLNTSKPWRKSKQAFTCLSNKTKTKHKPLFVLSSEVSSPRHRTIGLVLYYTRNTV